MGRQPIPLPSPEPPSASTPEGMSSRLLFRPTSSRSSSPPLSPEPPSRTSASNRAYRHSSTCAANQEVVFGPAPNEFIGITSDTAFNTIFIGPSINGNGQAALQLINFSDATGLGASTPEPGSMALLGFGLLSAGLLRRRLRALASVRSGQC